MFKLSVIEILLDQLNVVLNPYSQITILQTLINLSMNDQNAIYIRTTGSEIIGSKLLLEQPILLVSEGDQEEEETKEMQFRIQLTALVVLRHLYSVDKNRKSFRFVFPAETS